MPVLYSFRRCPYAMRARLALAVSGQAVELREVVLRDKPAALLDASPKATVPVLVLPDGAVLEQSLDIMRWALQRHDPNGWLVPTHATLDAMLALVAQIDGDFKYHLDRYKYPNRYENESALSTVDVRRSAVEPIVLDLEARLARQRYLCGQHPALADMAIAPFIRQFAQVDLTWFAAQPWPQLQRWLGDWEQSALFMQVMRKYPPWQAGTVGETFPTVP